MSDVVPTMMTGDVTRRVGLTIPADLLKELGFTPVGQDKRATLWAQSDYPAMCVSLGNWLKERQKVPMQPKPAPAAKKEKKDSKPPTGAKPSATPKYDVDDL